jgi:pimeloyl-ACP methyl ester carboxylesterase
MVSYMERWRESVGLSKFCLVAHSYGAYVAGCYAIHYPQYISKLILLSPLGVRIPPVGWKFENMAFSGGRRPPAWWRSVSVLTWGKFSIFAVARKLTESAARKIVGRYVRNMQPGRNEEENVALENYLY